MKTIDEILAAFEADKEASHQRHLAAIRNVESTSNQLREAREAALLAFARWQGAAAVAAHVRSGA